MLMSLVPIADALAWFSGVLIAGPIHQFDKLLMLHFDPLHFARAKYQQFAHNFDFMHRLIRAERQTIQIVLV